MISSLVFRLGSCSYYLPGFIDPLDFNPLGGAPESFPQSPCLFYLGAFLDKMVWFYLGYTDLRPLLGTNAAKQAGYLSFFFEPYFWASKNTTL